MMIAKKTNVGIRRPGRIPEAPTGMELLYMAFASLVIGALLFVTLGPFIAGPARQVVCALLAAGLVFVVRYSPFIVRRAHFAIIRAQHNRDIRKHSS